MKNRSRNHRRSDLRRAVKRDLSHHLRRESAHSSFWRWLGVLGSVGWPIVLLAAGGAIIGQGLDRRWDTGVRVTLTLLFLGTVTGAIVAWRMIGGHRQ